MRLVQTPRKYPLPVPLAGVFDAPYKLILCNVEWWSHVSGMIDVLSALDAWVGDDDEKTRGIREIASLLSTDWSAMFVEDIRWSWDENTLQKKLSGVWYDVADFGDWVALMYATDTSIQEGLSAEIARATIAEGELSDEIEDHDLRITLLEEEMDTVQADILALETLVATHDTSIANLASRMDTAESDIDALDARLTAIESAPSNMWSAHYDFKTGEHGFGGGSGVSWTSTVGYSWSTSPIIIAKTDSSFLDGRIAFYRLELRKVGAGEQDYTVKIVPDTYSYGVAESGLNIRYHKLQNLPSREDLEIQFAASGSWILEGLTVFGYGDSNAYDD